MAQRPGVFFCDLSAAQITAARSRSQQGGALARGAETRKLSFLGKKPNLEWGMESSLDDGTEQPVDERTEDLLAFASHVYQADRLLKRPEVPPRDWYRELELHIGVHHAQLWNDQAVRLASLLKVISRDTIRLFFYPIEERRPPLPLPTMAPPVNGGICIFSTHFSSVFGIASQVQHGDLIASVRYGPGSPKSAQSKLIDDISKLIHGFNYVAFRLTPVGLPSVERTQRSQGFLQVALAASLARRLEISRIQLFDDAISSYHLRDRQLCGPGYAVRSSRPDFLWQALQCFERLEVGTDLEIRNPFQLYTAREVLASLYGKGQEAKRQKLLHTTDSCLEKELAKSLRPAWDGSIPHCGCCFACKVRRLAALAAGLERPGSHDAYAVDPMDPVVPATSLARLGENLQRRVEAYHSVGVWELKAFLESFDTGAPGSLDSRVLREIQSLSSEKLFLTSTPPAAVGSGTAIGGAQIFQWIIDVHQRFYRQVKAFLP